MCRFGVEHSHERERGTVTGFFLRYEFECADDVLEVWRRMELKHVSEDHAAWYRERLEHPDLFWGELARARLRWSREFNRVQDCDLTQGRLQWFIGRQFNVSGEQLRKVIGSARDARTHTGEVLGMSCTHAGRQGTLATHALQGHLPS